MPATLINGGPAGPDEVGGLYRNRILTDRVTWWRALGGDQGLLRGGVASTVPGQMALSYSALLAAVAERDTLGAVLNRGYTVWADTATVATFGPASASTRVDAVVMAFCDLAAGAGAFGTETSIVGGQIVVVPGVSGTTTPRTDTQIQAAVGSGGWFRLDDVTIPAVSTEISPVNVARNPALRPAFVRKPTATSRAATTTLAADPHLAVHCRAGETYTIDAVLSFKSGTGSDVSDFRVAASHPGGTVDSFMQGPGQAAGSGGTRGEGQWVARTGETMSPTTFIPGGISSSNVGMTTAVRFVYQCTADGIFNLTWAQDTSNANATILDAGSYLHRRRAA